MFVVSQKIMSAIESDEVRTRENGIERIPSLTISIKKPSFNLISIYVCRTYVDYRWFMLAGGRYAKWIRFSSLINRYMLHEN